MSSVLPCFASDGTGQTPDIGQKLIFAESARKLEEARETPGTGSTVRGLSATVKESRGWSGSPVSQQNKAFVHFTVNQDRCNVV